jgi:hypothetical protein
MSAYVLLPAVSGRRRAGAEQAFALRRSLLRRSARVRRGS